MLNVRVLGFAVAISLSILGCGGGGGTAGSSAVSVGAPTNLTVHPGERSGFFSLSWKAPTQGNWGYLLEGRLEGQGEFEKVIDELIPGEYTSIQLHFDVPPPEGTRYVFRICAVAVLGNQRSPYSNEVVYEAGPDAPTNLTASYDFNHQAVSLSWTPNSHVVDHCIIERAIINPSGNGTFDWSVLQGIGSPASSYMDTSVFENVDYVYRLTNFKGITGSSPVSSPVVHAGWPTVSNFSANLDDSLRCVEVTWDLVPVPIPSQLQVRIERAESDASGVPSGAWVSLGMVGSSSTSFKDCGFPEATYVVYRLTPVAGSLEGAPVRYDYPLQTPILSPTNFRLTPTSQGFRLDWDNQSQASTEIVIKRTPSYANWNYEVAFLGPSTTSYEDLGLALGYYTYQVEARKGLVVGSTECTTSAVLNPANSLKLVAGATFPTLLCGAVLPEGGWVLGDAFPIGVRTENASWPAFTSWEGWPQNSEFVRVDSLGHPHAVYSKYSAAPGLKTIVHSWFDGTIWQNEDVTTTNLAWTSDANGFEFAIDSGGALHLLLDHATNTDPYGGSTSTLTYVHKSGGIYVAEPVSTFLDAAYRFDSYRVQVDGTGLPHLLLGNWETVIDCARGVDGKWQVETLPTVAGHAGPQDFLDACWVDAKNGWIFYESYQVDGSNHYALMGLQRKEGVWRTPVVIAQEEFSQRVKVAMSQGGSRIVVYQDSALGRRLFNLQEGAWVGTLLAPQGGYAPIPMGFDSDRKLHILLPSDSAGSQFQEYREP